MKTGMAKNNCTSIVFAGHDLKIPDQFRQMETLPGDPEGAAVYGMQNAETECIVMFFLIDKNQAMPFETDTVSKGVRERLRDKQELVDIQTQLLGDGGKCIYTVVKSVNAFSRIQYNLTLQIAWREHVLHAQGYFDDRRAEDKQSPDLALPVLRQFVNTLLGTSCDKPEGEDARSSLEDILKELGMDMESLQATINEILPGIAMYVRDVDLNKKCAEAYQPGMILMERGFTDASARVMGMNTTHRFTILSNHMADFGDVEHDTNWNLFVANHGAHFKVLDVYEYQGRTQILLLHLPDDDRWKLFKTVTLSLEEKLIDDSRKRFENKCVLEVVPELNTPEWKDRCKDPVGMDEDGTLYDINEPVNNSDADVLNIDYQVTVRVIMQQLTDDNEKNIAWLKTAMERNKNHPRGSEIIKACARKLYELLPEDSRKQMDQVVGKAMNALDERLSDIRRLILEKKLEEAKPLMEALANEADENTMFREDSVSRFFRFREWFEECLYRHMYEPEKELRMAQYPYDEIYSLQGSMYIDLQDLDKARECLKKALAWNPVNVQIAFEYAETFKIAGDMEAFFEETGRIQKFAIHSRDVARFLRNVGFYFTETGNYKEAMMCYMRSLLYERDSQNAANEITYLNQQYDVQIAMPDAEECRDFSNKHGFFLGPDKDVLGMMYAYGKHFMDENQQDAAVYCFSLLYELTEDPEIREILKKLGKDVEDQSEITNNTESSEDNSVLYFKNNKVDARGRQIGKGFLVLAGSKLSKTPTKSCPDAIRTLRRKHEKDIDSDSILRKDLEFTSASQAASFVMYASTNGLISWMDERGRTLKDLKG